jgi:hypothetical protein
LETAGYGRKIAAFKDYVFQGIAAAGAVFERAKPEADRSFSFSRERAGRKRARTKSACNT